MKSANTLTREKSIAQGTVSTEISRVGVGAIGVTSILIGCWAVVTLVSGMVSVGGPVGLVSSFMTAIGG